MTSRWRAGARRRPERHPALRHVEHAQVWMGARAWATRTGPDCSGIAMSLSSRSHARLARMASASDGSMCRHAVAGRREDAGGSSAQRIVIVDDEHAAAGFVLARAGCSPSRCHSFVSLLFLASGGRQGLAEPERVAGAGGFQRRQDVVGDRGGGVLVLRQPRPLAGRTHFPGHTATRESRCEASAGPTDTGSLATGGWAWPQVWDTASAPTTRQGMSVYLSTDRSGGPEHGKRIGAGHDPDVAGELFMVDTPLRATPALTGLARRVSGWISG